MTSLPLMTSLPSPLAQIFPPDIARHIMSFIPIDKSLGWSKALTLKCIQENYGLENVNFQKIPPIHVLECLIGDRTRTVHYSYSSPNKFVDFTLEFLDTTDCRNLHNLHQYLHNLYPYYNANDISMHGVLKSLTFRNSCGVIHLDFPLERGGPLIICKEKSMLW